MTYSHNSYGDAFANVYDEWYHDIDVIDDIGDLAEPDPIEPSEPTEPVESSPQATATPPLVAEGDFVPLGAGVTPPVRTSGAAAPYPPAARRGGMSGTVAVDILVDEKGTPTQVDVIESAGKILDDAVVKAVKTWHFEPATKDGIRVKTRLRSRQTYK